MDGIGPDKLQLQMLAGTGQSWEVAEDAVPSPAAGGGGNKLSEAPRPPSPKRWRLRPGQLRPTEAVPSQEGDMVHPPPSRAASSP